MDLLDFDGEPMYFDQPVGAQVDALLTYAAERYGEPEAEHSLLRAYFLEPEHLTVLVALYRHFYYRHRYADALRVAERAIGLTAVRLGLCADWRALSRADLGGAVVVSMTLTRFLLLALKGSGYLKLRLGDAADALERFEKVVEMDTSDRLGVSELVSLARAKVTEARVAASGGKVTLLAT
jgi:tetratricopeptide (TPR) repeat protein